MRKTVSPMKEEIKVPKLGMNIKIRVGGKNGGKNVVETSGCSPKLLPFSMLIHLTIQPPSQRLHLTAYLAICVNYLQ